nr:polyketide synthase dehydratase domain-containing protein [Gordonia soli]
MVRDGTEPERLTTTIRFVDDGSSRTILATDENGRPRFRATIRPDAERIAPPPPLSPLPVVGAADPTDAYATRVLFHGPALQGVRRIVTHDDDQLVAECRLGTPPVADGAYEVGLYDSNLGDVVGQVVAPWIRHKYGKSPMPAAVARVDIFRRLPYDEPFFVVASGFGQTSENVVVGTLTSYDSSGEVLQVVSGFEAVMSEALNALFAGENT